MAFNAADSFGNVVDSIVAMLPALLGAVVVLFVGYLIAKAVENLLERGLSRTRLNQLVSESSAGRLMSGVKTSRVIGSVTFWVIMLGAISLAVSILGIDALNAVLASVYAYLPHVIAAALIFIVAVAISAGVATFVGRTMGETPTGKLVASIVPGLIMSIAVFMILTELQIATPIVLITFTALIGSVALGSALAFGLGGREVAGRMLETAYTKGQDLSAQARTDFATGRERAKEQVPDMVAAARESKSDAMPMPGAAQPTFGERIEDDSEDQK